MSAYDARAWSDFGVAVVGAAAALTGLIFISVSINLGRVLAVRGLAGRAGESVVLFVGALVAAVFLLVPGQSAAALGVELAATGAALAALLLAIALPALRHPTRQPRPWRVLRVVLAVAVTGPMVMAGLSLIGGRGAGLYWLVASVVLAVAAGTANAWVLLVEVVRDHRYQPTGADAERPGGRGAAVDAAGPGTS